MSVLSVTVEDDLEATLTHDEGEDVELCHDGDQLCTYDEDDVEERSVPCVVGHRLLHLVVPLGDGQLDDVEGHSH